MGFLSTVHNSAAVHCYQHPQRLGIGICVVCRQVVCAECSTPFEGINRCAACLAKMAPRAELLRVHREWSAGAIASSACVLGLMYGGVWWLSRWIAP